MVYYRAKPYLHETSLKTIYALYIHSYLNYANIVSASTPITKLKPLLYKHKQAVRIAFKVLCYLQILKNTKFVRIILKSILQQLINPVLSSKKWEIWDGRAFCFLTSPFFLQCYKPQYNSFKVIFDLLLINAIDLHYRHRIKYLL